MAEELGLVAAAGIARVGRPVRKAAHGGAAVSQETVAPLAARAARSRRAHAVAVVSVNQKTPSLVARAARTQTRAVQRAGCKAVLPCLGWAHGAVMETMGVRSGLMAAVEAVAARAAAGVLGAVVHCPAMEVAEAALAPLVTHSWLLPHHLS